jgi:hypothetical protein
MLDDNALDPSRNQCSVVISRLFGLVVLEEVACCCIEVVQLGDQVHEQRIVKAMVNMPCNHLPDVAQQLMEEVMGGQINCQIMGASIVSSWM